MKKTLPLFLALFLFSLSACSTQRTVLTGSQIQGLPTNTRTVDLLIGQLKSPRPQRDLAYKRLIEIGKPAAPKLMKLLNSDDPDMREYAAAILGSIDYKKAVKPLIAMLQGHRRRRYIAAWALGMMRAKEAIGPLVAALSVKNDAIQKEATRALINLGPEAVPALIAALKSPDVDTREFSIRALGEIEDRRAEEPIMRLLNDKNNGVTEVAALALGNVGTDKSIPSLIKTLNSNDITTKVNASISLGQLGAKAAIPRLTAMMKTDKDSYVRQWCARALENINGRKYKYKNENGVMVFPYNLYR